MAYSTLPTQSAGGTASAAGWANIVKADLESMVHLVVRKTSDESDATGTPQSDDVLILPVAANEVWQFKFVFLVVSAASTDFALRFNAPASANLSGITWGINATTFQGDDFSATSFPTGSGTFQTQGTLVDMFISEGVIVNAGTGGSLTPQWSGGAAATCTVKANSTLWACKLA